MAISRATPTSEFSTYTLIELRTRWGRAEVTPDQMIGQLLLHLMVVEQRVRQLEQPPRSDAGDQPPA